MNWLEWVVALVLVLAVAWLGSKVVRWTKGMPKGAYLLMALFPIPPLTFKNVEKAKIEQRKKQKKDDDDDKNE